MKSLAVLAAFVAVLYVASGVDGLLPAQSAIAIRYAIAHPIDNAASVLSHLHNVAMSR